MDSAVDEHAAAVLFGPVAPSRGLEGVLFLQLDQPEVSQAALADQFLGLAYRRQEPVVFRHHQFNTGGLGLRQDGIAVQEGCGDGFFHQDVLALAGGQGNVLEVEMVRGADIEGVHARVSGGGGIAAEGVQPVEAGGVIAGPVQVAAGEVEVNFVPQAVYGPGKNLGEGTTTQDTQSKAQGEAARFGSLEGGPGLSFFKGDTITRRIGESRGTGCRY